MGFEPVTDLAEYLVVLLDGPAVALEGGGEGHTQHHLPAPALEPARLPANRGRNEGIVEKIKKSLTNGKIWTNVRVMK